MVSDKGSLPVTLFTSSNQGTEPQNLLKVIEIGRVSTDRFQAVLQGRIEARKAELTGRGIIG